MDKLLLYKGYSVKPLVFRHQQEGVQTRDRSFNVAVSIGRSNDPAHAVITFRMPVVSIFDSFGDARRAGEQFGQDIINGKVPGCSLDSLPVTGDSAGS